MIHISDENYLPLPGCHSAAANGQARSVDVDAIPVLDEVVNQPVLPLTPESMFRLD